jgi:hypothetical protein
MINFGGSVRAVTGHQNVVPHGVARAQCRQCYGGLFFCNSGGQRVLYMPGSPGNEAWGKNIARVFATTNPLPNVF